jgi:glycosyltransferase involved in cell wall biosynthesis
MLAQTYSNLEIIIGDDCSNDATKLNVAGFDDPRIRYYRNGSNLGIYGNWNALLARATGEYVCIYHDHDIYSDTIVERSLDLMLRERLMSFVHTPVLLIDSSHQVLRTLRHDFPEVTASSLFQEKQLKMNCVVAATAMIRKSTLAKVGNFDPSYGLGSDSEFWLRASRSGPVGYVQSCEAGILSREPSQFTARFSWNDEMQHLRLRQEWVPKVYHKWQSRRRAYALMRSSWDRRMLRLALRSLTYDDLAQFEEKSQLAFGSCHSVRYRLLCSWVKRCFRWDLLRSVLKSAHARQLRNFKELSNRDLEMNRFFFQRLKSRSNNPI